MLISFEIRVQVTVMRSCVWRSAVVAIAVMAVGTSLMAGDAGKALQKGDDLPAPFDVYMVTGPRAGKFHCPVCESGLNLGVLIFVRDASDIDKAPLLTLLKKLDVVIGKHPSARIGACAVVLDDGGYRKALETKIEESSKITDLTLTKATEAREGKEATLAGVAKKNELKDLTLALGTKGGPEGYKLSENADVTVLIYHKLRIVGNYAFKKGEITEKDVDTIVNQVDTTAADIVKGLRRKP
jgi:hypothetical protein